MCSVLMTIWSSDSFPAPSTRFGTDAKCPWSGKKHWLDYAKPDYDDAWLSNCKMVYHTFSILFDIPFVYAVEDLGGMRLNYQTTHMTGDLGMGVYILPDQFDL